MRRKLQAVARVMRSLGAIDMLTAVRAATTRTLAILAYHRVLDVPDEVSFPFDLELVSTSIAGFREQMAHVRRHFRPTTFEAVLKGLAAGIQPPPGSIIVTFDDGFEDNYRNAYPILREMGVPATIFLATGYLDRQDLFWYDRLAWVVMTSPAAALRDCGLADGIDPAPAARRALLARELRYLKTLPDRERVARLERAFAALPTSGDWRKDGRSGPLTWEQVREMSDNGIEFGSHTVNHPILSRVAPADLASELVPSKRRIEDAIGKPVDIIAYPVGGQGAFDTNVRNAVAAAGYKLGISYVSGVQRPQSWDPYAIRRLHVERYTDMTYFRAMLAAPSVFS